MAKKRRIDPALLEKIRQYRAEDERYMAELQQRVADGEKELEEFAFFAYFIRRVPMDL